ncbi:Type 1 phosphatases regulator ypi1 [Rhodotorula kratochvilovae]
MSTAPRAVGPTPASHSSRTLTLSDAPPSTSSSADPAHPAAAGGPGPSTAGVLRLRGRGDPGRGVTWAGGTVDNEGLGRKKSKICCIYHKPRAFDESSDESDSSGSDSDGSDDSRDGRAAARRARRARHHHHHHDDGDECGHDHGAAGEGGAAVRDGSAGSETQVEERKPQPNAYERGTAGGGGKGKGKAT